MTWFKVDDQLHSHPKMRRAGLESAGLWVAAGSFCMAYKTDGFVPSYFVIGWPRGLKLAARLVDVGLWELATRHGESGWYFHDWTHYQPSDEEIEQSRRFARDRQRRYREKQAKARAEKGELA